MTLTIHQPAPTFTLPATGGRTISLKDFAGQKLVIYFYPKDDTPGCTVQACDLRDNLSQLNNLGVQVIGISRDNVAKHEKFAAKFKLNFPLLADEDGAVCTAYGVLAEKSMFGKKYMGIERSTFLIDEKGSLAAMWRKVKVGNHIRDIQKALKEKQKAQEDEIQEILPVLIFS